MLSALPALVGWARVIGQAAAGRGAHVSVRSDWRTENIGRQGNGGHR